MRPAPRVPSPVAGHSSIFVDPEARLVGGFLTVLVTLALMPGGRAFGWLLACLAVGIAWLASGIEGVRRRARRRREIARAQAEWDLLRTAYAAAARAGQRPSELLRERDYRDYEVRKCIVRLLHRGGSAEQLAACE